MSDRLFLSMMPLYYAITLVQNKTSPIYYDGEPCKSAALHKHGYKVAYNGVCKTFEGYWYHGRVN